jgi:hypothetical protein
MDRLKLSARDAERGGARHADADQDQGHSAEGAALLEREPANGHRLMEILEELDPRHGDGRSDLRHSRPDRLKDAASGPAAVRHGHATTG